MQLLSRLLLSGKCLLIRRELSSVQSEQKCCWNLPVVNNAIRQATFLEFWKSDTDKGSCQYEQGQKKREMVDDRKQNTAEEARKKKGRVRECLKEEPLQPLFMGKTSKSNKSTRPKFNTKKGKKPKTPTG